MPRAPLEDDSRQLLGVIYRYDGADRLVETPYANLARTTRGYDAAGQLETLKHLRAGPCMRRPMSTTKTAIGRR